MWVFLSHRLQLLHISCLVLQEGGVLVSSVSFGFAVTFYASGVQYLSITWFLGGSNVILSDLRAHVRSYAEHVLVHMDVVIPMA